jgi:hypothetical protein
MIRSNSSHSKNNCEGFTVKEYLQRDLIEQTIRKGFLWQGNSTRVLTQGFHYTIDNPTRFRTERIISQVFYI